MADFDILDTDTTNMVEPRDVPEARYIATYVSYESAKTSKGTEKIVMNWRLETPLDNQDMTGVNLGRLITGDIFMTEKTLPYVKKEFRTGFNYEPSAKPRDWFEDNIGKTAVVTVAYDPWWKKTKGINRPVIAKFVQA